MKPTLNEQLARMQKIAGIISENQDYYKDAEKDDAAHIDALEKDMKDDAKKTSEGKMTKSDLKAKIKEMILAELTEDDDVDINNPGDLNNMYDPLAEAEEEAEEEYEAEDDSSAESLYKMFKKYNLDNDRREYDAEDFMMAYPNLSQEEAEKLEDMLQNPLDESIGDNWDFTKPKDVDRKTVTAIETAFRNLDIVKNLVMFGQFTDREMEDQINYMKTLLATLHKSIFGISGYGTTLKEAKKDKVMLNGKEVDVNSIEVEGGSYNDYSDVYISVAKFKDGTDLNNDEREELENLVDMGELANDSLSEAKKDEEVEDVTVDDTEVVDAPESDMMAGESAEISGIQSNLQAAYAEAKALGDEKLITQIANTITYFTKAHILDTAPINEAEGNLNQVRNKLLGLFQPYGNFQISDMTMKGQNLGTEFRLYSKSKDADWKGLENFMKNNPDFSIKNISKQTFDNPKSIDFSYKTDQINENMFPMLKRILR